VKAAVTHHVTAAIVRSAFIEQMHDGGGAARRARRGSFVRAS
jgi:hypothetical protein